MKHLIFTSSNIERANKYRRWVSIFKAIVYLIKTCPQIIVTYFTASPFPSLWHIWPFCHSSSFLASKRQTASLLWRSGGRCTTNKKPVVSIRELLMRDRLQPVLTSLWRCRQRLNWFCFLDRIANFNELSYSCGCFRKRRFSCLCCIDLVECGQLC